MESKIKYIKYHNEECRLQYLVNRYKEHDRKRNRYIEELLAEIERLNQLTQHQHEDIDELIDAYENAKPLVQNPKQKAYIYELIKRSRESSNFKSKCQNLTETNKQLSDKNRKLKEKNTALTERIHALEEIIKKTPQWEITKRQSLISAMMPNLRLHPQ